MTGVNFFFSVFVSSSSVIRRCVCRALSGTFQTIALIMYNEMFDSCENMRCVFQSRHYRRTQYGPLGSSMAGRTGDSLRGGDYDNAAEQITGFRFGTASH